MAEAVTLGSLASAVEGRLLGDPEVLISDVTHDSRQAGPGMLFVAVRGMAADGHEFVSAAVEAGSPAVVVEIKAATSAPQVVVADTRRALGPLAATVHHHPSRELRLVGVTGTNGKTTVTHLIESIGRAAGISAALVGTVGARIGDEVVDVVRTTPEATDFQRILRRMVDRGIELAAVEVSSHALALHRVSATRFAVGAFTNLSQDHLDFHGDMESYERVKASLFEACDHAVVWVDDPAGKRIADGAPCPVTTVGTGPDADVRLGEVELGRGGSRFVLADDDGDHDLEVALAGRFNVFNAAIAAAVARHLGIAREPIAAGLASVGVVPGRFERVDVGGDLLVVVDYAHTPGGISAVIAAAREIVGSGRVVAVVGAGGERDRTKRPLMGAAAGGADVVVLTSDNPRSESPEAILAEVAAGAPAGAVREVDRRAAIRHALASAGPGDAVLILGKGHERNQDFGDRVVPFDDRTVAMEEAGSR